MRLLRTLYYSAEATRKCGAAPSTAAWRPTHSRLRYGVGVSVEGPLATLLTAAVEQKPRPDVSASDATGVKWRAYLATAGLRRLPLGVCGSNSTLVTYTHLGHS